MISRLRLNVFVALALLGLLLVAVMTFVVEGRSESSPRQIDSGWGSGVEVKISPRRSSGNGCPLPGGPCKKRAWYHE